MTTITTITPEELVNSPELTINDILQHNSETTIDFLLKIRDERRQLEEQIYISKRNESELLKAIHLQVKNEHNDDQWIVCEEHLEIGDEFCGECYAEHERTVASYDDDY